MSLTKENWILEASESVYLLSGVVQTPFGCLESTPLQLSN